jgi:hypothetical protein
VRVVQKTLKQADKFPLISVTCEDNKNVIVSTDFNDRTDQITLTINVYAEDMNIGNKVYSSAYIASELIKLVDEVCSRKYKLLRTSCRQTPNLDETIYRITARYTKKIISNKNLLI